VDHGHGVVGGPKSEAASAESGGGSWEGIEDPLPASSPTAIHGEAPATCQFRTFYMLTKPLLVQVHFVKYLMFRQDRTYYLYQWKGYHGQ